MFQTARLKLTGWYLLIIMAVSLSFSAVIYRALTVEVERFGRIQRYRIEHRLQNDVIIPFEDSLPPPPMPPIDDTALVNYVKHRILTVLALVNSSIFILSGLLGYMLAGRTLKPIADMVDEQNRFISDASHEFRTPLTALKSAMEVSLRDKNLTLADAKKILGDNIADVDKLQSLSDGLLQLAQYQKPNGHTTLTKIRIEEVVRSALKKVEFSAKQKDIAVKTRIKPVTFIGNSYGVTDLLVILLDNAIKYSPGHSSITVNAHRTDGWLELAVADQGIGIAVKDMPHIFDRFYRADTARSKTVAGGYGLGLAIAKKITDLHHGTISVKSVAKRGSTFTVRLPIKPRSATT